MAKVTLLNIDSETAKSILNQTDIPYYGYININGNKVIPSKIKYNSVYYRLEGNNLVAFKVLAQSIGRNGKPYQLIQFTDGRSEWICDYWGFCGYPGEKQHNKIFASVDDYVKYLETNDWKLIANNGNPLFHTQSVFGEYDGRIYDRYCDNLYCKHTYVVKDGIIDNVNSTIDYIFMNEQGVFFIINHYNGYDTREKAINSLLKNVVVTDFEEKVIDIHIQVKETNQQKYKIQLV